MGKARRPLAPVFILAPPLGLGGHLGACLGRHPGLFALPAINLMCGDTPRDLALRWGDRLGDHDHGLIRAVAALITRDVNTAGADDPAAERAAAWLAARADQHSADLFAALQQAAHPRRLIDASFLYPVDDTALARLAEAAPDARFIHFLRHPAQVLSNPEMAGSRTEGLWLRPHLRIHAFLSDQPAGNWLRLRAEDLAARPRPLLAGLLQWLGLTGAGSGPDPLIDAAGFPLFADVGPASARHGVDPALVSDPALTALFDHAPDPNLDDDAYVSAGFDLETRAMARLFGYV